jgi:PAS domain S-box-containing protein
VLRVLFERAPEIITVTNNDGRQLLVNPEARRLLGITPSGDGPYDGWPHVHPDDVPALLAVRQYFHSNAVRAEPPPPVRYRVRDAGGAWRWLEMAVADLRDVPEVEGLVAFSRDVTEAEQRAQALRESRARLDALVASLRAGAMVEDAEGTVILANDLLLAGFGIPGNVAVVVGRSRDEALAVLAGALLDSSALLAAAREPADVHRDLECELRSGTWFDVEVVPIRADGQDFGRLWLFHDTTARRRAEQQRQHLLDLEQQARRDAELQAERLQAYDRLRNEFVARVSHELRTPLTSIASASELLLSDDSAPEESVRQRLEIVRRNAERLPSFRPARKHATSRWSSKRPPMASSRRIRGGCRRSSRTCSATRSSSPIRARKSSCGSPRPAAAGCCRSVTMARASRRPCDRTSSSGSCAARTPIAAGHRGPAWAWPS